MVSDNGSSGAGAEAVCAAFYQRVLAYARRLTDPVTAEDVAQEVFLRLLKYKGEDAGSVSVHFLLAMARNVAMNALSGQGRRAAWSAVEGDGGSDADPALVTRPDAEARAMRLWLREALGDLSERQREAIVLTSLRGLSEEEAGLSLRLSRSAISAQRRKGLDRLRRVGRRMQAGVE